MLFIILIPFILITVTLAILIHSISEKYYRLLFAENTVHHFSCSNCQQEYDLAGPETKSRIKHKGFMLISKKQQYSFTCPICQKKGTQVKLATTYNND